MAISLRLSTCRGTIIATATRLPRCARNDMRKTERPWFEGSKLPLPRATVLSGSYAASLGSATSALSAPAAQASAASIRSGSIICQTTPLLTK